MWLSWKQLSFFFGHVDNWKGLCAPLPSLSCAQIPWSFRRKCHPSTQFPTWELSLALRCWSRDYSLMLSDPCQPTRAGWLDLFVFSLSLIRLDLGLLCPLLSRVFATTLPLTMSAQWQLFSSFQLYTICLKKIITLLLYARLTSLIASHWMPETLPVAKRPTLLTLCSGSRWLSCFLLTACSPAPFMCLLLGFTVWSPSPSLTWFLLLLSEHQLYFLPPNISWKISACKGHTIASESDQSAD